jgi:hypothetical protein
MQKMNLNNLRTKVNEMSHADYRPIQFAEPDTPDLQMSDEDRKINRFTAIWNREGGFIESVQSKHYKIIQHEDAFMPIVDVLENTGVTKDCFVKTQEYSGKAYMKLAFPEMKFTPADGKEVYLGFVAKNSYNGTSGLWVGGFGMRMCCTNQMVMRNLIQGKSIKHMGNVEEVSREIGAFVLEIGESIPMIQQTIEDALAQSITPQKATEELLERKFGKKRTEQLIERFEAGDEQNRWTLYNVITDYASHEVDKARVENRLLSLAENVLTARVVA